MNSNRKISRRTPKTNPKLQFEALEFRRMLTTPLAFVDLDAEFLGAMSDVAKAQFGFEMTDAEKTTLKKRVEKGVEKIYLLGNHPIDVQVGNRAAAQAAATRVAPEKSVEFIDTVTDGGSLGEADSIDYGNFKGFPEEESRIFVNPIKDALKKKTLPTKRDDGLRAISYYVANLIAHELGHSYGLRHTDGKLDHEESIETLMDSRVGDKSLAGLSRMPTHSQTRLHWSLGFTASTPFRENEFPDFRNTNNTHKESDTIPTPNKTGSFVGEVSSGDDDWYDFIVSRDEEVLISVSGGITVKFSVYRQLSSGKLQLIKKDVAGSKPESISVIDPIGQFGFDPQYYTKTKSTDFRFFLKVTGFSPYRGFVTRTPIVHGTELTAFERDSAGNGKLTVRWGNGTNDPQPFDAKFYDSEYGIETSDGLGAFRIVPNANSKKGELQVLTIPKNEIHNDTQLIIAGKIITGSELPIPAFDRWKAPTLKFQIIPLLRQPGNKLRIEGTEFDDDVRLESNPSGIRVVGIGFDEIFSDISVIEVELFGGDDVLNVDQMLGIPIAAYGGFGNDILNGGAADDFLVGGAGVDLFYARPGDLVVGEEAVAGDVNRDGVVDFTDFLILSANYGSQDASWEDGDFDGDGNVGFNDFLALNQAFGYTS